MARAMTLQESLVMKPLVVITGASSGRHPRPHIASHTASKATVLALAKEASPMLLTGDLPKEVMIQTADVATTGLWMLRQPVQVCLRDVVMVPTGFES